MFFVIKKFITYFIIPPGFFVSLFVILFLVTKEKVLKKIFILLSVLIYLISISPTKDLLLYPLLVKFEDSNCDDFDAIVILGGGVYAGGELKEDSLKRLVEGYIIAKEFDKPIILSGGRVSKKIEPEAMVMRKKLIKLGFDGRIFLDDKSKDTFENAKFVKRIITDNGYKKVLLITSGYHLLRSKFLFDKLGVNSCVKLVDKKIDKKYNFIDFLPTPSNMYIISKIIKEYLGLLFYSIK